MDPTSKFALVVLIATALVHIATCEQSVKKKERTFNAEKIVVCNDRPMIALVHCFCNKTDTVSSLECWVFNNGLSFDDRAWDDLQKASNVQLLTFNVRTDGALTYIPYKAFRNFKKLLYLNIDYADIEFIQPFAFKSLSHLKELNLHTCGVKELQSMAFAEMTMLNNISLIDNEISYIKVDVFFALPNLRKLYLSNNTISDLASGCFKHLHGLSELHLDGNSLAVLKRDHYLGLTNLLKLNLQGNKIKSVENSVFSVLRNLNELILDGNNILFVSPEGFKGLTQVRSLSLNGNHIAAVNAKMLEPLKSLRHLSVKNNNIKNIDEDTVSSIMGIFNSTYSDLELDGNKMICDCRLSWIRDLLNEARSPKLQRSMAAFHCLVEPTTQSKLAVYSVLTSTPNAVEDPSRSNNTEVIFRKFLDIPAEFLPCPFQVQSAIVDYDSSSAEKFVQNKVMVLVVCVAILCNMLW